MKSVVHFIDSETIGGCEEVIRLLVANADVGWKVIFLHYDSDGGREVARYVSRRKVECVAVPKVERFSDLRKMQKLVNVIKDVHPDVFHAHLNSNLGCKNELIAARAAGVRAIVVTAHLYSSPSGIRFRSAKQWLHRCFIDRYLAVSEEVSRKLQVNLRVKDDKIRVVRNGIEIDRYQHGKNRLVAEDLLAGNERPIVLTTARLHPQKGHRYLLDAARKVPNALFVFAGDGPDKLKLEQMAFEKGIQDRVLFLGRRDDIPDLLAACDLFVLPSLFEGLPLSVLEAMAAGKPVIATAIGGTNEAVISGETGILVPPGDSSSLAKSILMLLENHEISHRFGVAARERAWKLFSTKTMAAEVMENYDDVLSKKESCSTWGGNFVEMLLTR